MHKMKPKHKEYIDLYNSGLTLKEIGTKYGCSKQNIQQILCRYGVTNKTRSIQKKPKVHKAVCIVCNNAFESKNRRITCSKPCFKAYTLENRIKKARKLTPEQVDEIISLVLKGDLTYKQISAQFGVSTGAITSLLSGRTWKDHPGNPFTN